MIFIGGSLSWAPSYIQNNLKFFGVLDFKARAEKCKEIMVSVKKTNKRFLGFWHTLYKLSYSLHFFPIFASFKEKKSTTNNESLFWANMRERKKEKTEMNKWSRVCYWYIDEELKNFRFPLIHQLVGSLKGQACNVFAFKTLRLHKISDKNTRYNKKYNDGVVSRRKRVRYISDLTSILIL